MSALIRNLSRLSGPLVFLSSLGLFWSTRCLSPFPGDSARALVMHLDRFPVRSLEAPLFGLLVRLANRIWGSSFIGPLHGLCAIGGALGIWMTYQILLRLGHNRSTEEESSTVNEGMVRWISATAGAVLLATTSPYWMISTRAFPLQVGVLLMLAWILHALVLWERRGVGHLFLNVFMFSVGLAEYRSFLILLPVFALYILFLLIVDHLQNLARVLLGCAAAFLAGCSLYVFSAWRLASHASASLLGITSFGEALGMVVRNQVASLSSLMPQTGWLLVAIYTVIPLLLVMIPKRSANRMIIWGSIFLHLVLTIAGFMVLLNAPISPWPLLHFSPFLVAPYVAYALYMGYLAGYWIRVLLHIRNIDPIWQRGLKSGLGGLYIPVLLTGIMVSAQINFGDIRPDYLRPIDAWSHAILEHLPEGTFVISDTGLEDILQLTADSTGQDLTFVTPKYTGKSWYRNHLTTLFDDPQLQNLSQISLSALFQHWLSSDPNAVNRIHSVNYPDLFYAAALQPIPDRWGYSGHPLKAGLDMERYLPDQQRFWEESCFNDLKNTVLPKDHPLQGIYTVLLRESSRRLNDLGVCLEEQGHPEDAATWYEKAYAMDSGNLSVILNGYGLQQRENLEGTPWAEAYRTLRESKLPRMNMWQLARRYGYVHQPQIYVNRGLSWALSGKPQIGLQELKRAQELTGPNRSMHLTLAQFYFQQDELTESQTHLLEVLSNNPNDMAAIRGLFRIATAAGRFDQARSFLLRMRALAGPSETLTREELALRLAEEDYTAASSLLEQLREHNPDDVRLLFSQYVLAIKAEDRAQERELEFALNRMRRLPADVALAYADVLLSQGKMERSMKVIGDSLQWEPRHPLLLERALRLSVRMGDRTLSMQLAPLLLENNPGHAYANLVLGSDHFLNGNLSLAETAFRASLHSARTPEVLNSLAYILQISGPAEEAHSLIEEALQLSPLDPRAWDTLGMVLYRLSNFEGAEQALRKSLELDHAANATYIHLARVQLAQGKHQAAAQLIEELLAKAEELNQPALEELMTLRDALPH